MDTWLELHMGSGKDWGVLPFFRWKRGPEGRGLKVSVLRRGPLGFPHTCTYTGITHREEGPATRQAYKLKNS
jgi:hypothetical protein